jgi:segregation and condensation protein B
MTDHDSAEPIEKSLFESPPLAEQERMIEAMLFASATPLTLAEMQARMPHASDPAEAMVALRRRYEGRGVNLVKIGDAYGFRTAGDLGFLMSSQAVETRKLSRAAIPAALASWQWLGQ